MPKTKPSRRGTENDVLSLADKLFVVAQIFQRVAGELMNLDDEVRLAPKNRDKLARRTWRTAQVEDVLHRLNGSKLLNAEAFASIHGRLLEGDYEQLVVSGVTRADAKERLREQYGYKASQPTAIRDALTDVRRIRAGKAPLKARTRRPSSKT